MPDPVTPTTPPAAPVDPATPTDAPSPAPTKLTTARLLRDKGKLTLRLDVTGLHAYLDAIGIGRDPGYSRYLDSPTNGAEIVDTRTHKVSPRALMSTKYHINPDTGTAEPGILVYDILRVYSTPPTMATMEVIAESVREATIATINHYQPVEISVSVTSRRLGGPK